LTESDGPNLTVIVFCVPCSFDSILS
jgi:hypothetical protein